MTFSSIMNSPLLYILVAAGIGYVLIFSVLTLRRSYKHALKLGMEKGKVRGVITSAMVYSVVPSLSIVVGLVSLAAVLGTVMFVMSISILGGIVGVLLFGKGIQKNMAKVRGKGPFGVLAISVLQLALMAVFLPSMVTSGAVYIAVLLTSAVVAILHQLVIKKTGWKWLGNFVMADSLILGMLSSLAWTRLF